MKLDDKMLALARLLPFTMQEKAEMLGMERTNLHHALKRGAIPDCYAPAFRVLVGLPACRHYAFLDNIVLHRWDVLEADAEARHARLQDLSLAMTLLQEKWLQLIRVEVATSKPESWEEVRRAQIARSWLINGPFVHVICAERHRVILRLDPASRFHLENMLQPNVHHFLLAQETMDQLMRAKRPVDVDQALKKMPSRKGARRPRGITRRRYR